MSISEKLPGMRPGSTIRNLGVGVAYFFLVMMVLGAIVGDEADDEEGEATSDAAADEEEEASAAETEDEEDEAADDAEEVETDDDDAETGDENGDDPPETEDAPLEAEEESEEAEEEAEDVEDETDEETEQQITAEDAETLLAANGLDVTANETDDGVVMEYRDTVADENELAENLGAIAGAHAAWYGDDPSIGPLTIEMYNSQTGEHAGTTSVDESTVEAYANDEITAEEYSYELLTGLEAGE